MYWDKSELANRLQPAIDFRATLNVRLIAGEFGCDTQAPEASRVRWVGDVLDLLETNNFDWAYFTYDAGLILQKSWNFDGTSLEPLITAKMALNLP
jgi:hypothetical protein